MKIIIEVSSLEIFKIIIDEIYNKKQKITFDEVISILDGKNIRYLIEPSKDGNDFVNLVFGLIS